MTAISNIFVLLYIALTTAKSTLAQSCKDSSNFTFGTTPIGTTRTCSWLTQNFNKVEARLANWCNQRVDGRLVKNKCPVSCDNCRSPAPSSVPSSSPTKKRSNDPSGPKGSCIDDPAYNFGRYFFQGSWTYMTCEWITRNPTKVDKRRSDWCGKKVDGIVVAHKCAQACLQCEAGTCISTPNWTDSASGKTCNYYTNNFRCRNSPGARSACCQCGLGGCYNSPNAWKDKIGKGCDWYAQNNFFACSSGFATAYADENGVSGKDACCACDGGAVNLVPRTDTVIAEA